MSKNPVPPPSPLFFTVTDSELWYEEMQACILRFHLMVEGSTAAWEHPEWIEWFNGVFTPPFRKKTRFQPAMYEYAVRAFEHMTEFVSDNIREDDGITFFGGDETMLKKYIDQTIAGVFGLWVNHMLTGKCPSAKDVSKLVADIQKDFI